MLLRLDSRRCPIPIRGCRIRASIGRTVSVPTSHLSPPSRPRPPQLGGPEASLPAGSSHPLLNLLWASCSSSIRTVATRARQIWARGPPICRLLLLREVFSLLLILLGRDSSLSSLTNRGQRGFIGSFQELLLQYTEFVFIY